MISLAIKFEPTINQIKDSTGLSGKMTDCLTEGKFVPQIIKRVNKSVDVDVVLINNLDVMDEMIIDTKKLLEQARYNIKEYETFARST